MTSEDFFEDALSEKFDGPKEVKKWTDEEKRIATKNLLQDKTCENCRYNFETIYGIVCTQKNNEYNTCYKYRPNPDINDIFKTVRMSYPNTIKSELVGVQPMEKPDPNSMFYLKPEKNTLFRRIINKVKSIFNKRKELY